MFVQRGPTAKIEVPVAAAGSWELRAKRLNRWRIPAKPASSESADCFLDLLGGLGFSSRGLGKDRDLGSRTVCLPRHGRAELSSVFWTECMLVNEASATSGDKEWLCTASWC